MHRAVILFFIVVVLMTVFVSLSAIRQSPVSNLPVQIENLKSEYTTAGVIRDLYTYVTMHPGRWPASWKDIGDGADYSQFTKFRFDITIESILKNPELIYEAVLPVTGVYYTYPHATDQLEAILVEIRRSKDAKR